MGCFCRASVAVLATHLPGLNAALEIDLATGLPRIDATMHVGGEVAMALSFWLAARGHPAPPWQPNPAWLELALPMPRLSVSAIATISALAQLRAQVLAQFGLDLLVEAQVRAFVRIVATMNARLSVELTARLGLPATLNPLGWARLAVLNSAIDQVRVALQAGLLTPPPSLMLAMTMPGGIPIGRWGVLLRPLRLLAPLIAASLQLNASVSETVQLAAALKVLARINLPALAVPELMANLGAALSATASLQASLGIAPLTVGLPEVQVLVRAKLAVLLTALSVRLGIDFTESLQLRATVGLPAVGPLLARLMAMLPKLPMAPGSLATADSVNLALRAQALAALDWQVPANLAVIQTGLATCTLAAQLQASLGLQAVLPAPCGSGCDAAKLMGALGKL